MNLRSIATGALALAVASSFGCSTFVDSVINHGADKAGETVGNSVGNSMGNSMVAAYGPQMQAAMMRSMFIYAFNGVGGYMVDEAPYQPGEYTRWSIKGQDDKTITLERAFLKVDADGNQWWKVKYTVPKSGDEQQDTVLTYEMLFAKDGSKLLRVRSKTPADKEPKEMPVEENTFGYVQPRALTAQSRKGGDKGVETVSVPAGSFKAHHLVFGGYGSNAEFWESSKVPGHTVKYGSTVDNKDGSGNTQAWMAELAAYGSDATTELGSY